MSSNSSHVVKIAVADTAGEAVLVHVTAKGTGGLDLDLLATDGDSAFKTKVRERNLAKLRAKTYDGSDSEWKDMLKHILVSKQQTGSSTDEALRTLEVSCSKSGQDPHTSLTITLRRRVENITQRLGAIEMPQTDDTDDVDLFGWACQLIDERDQLEASLNQEKGVSSSTHDTIASLREQLADLVQSKQDHEQELLSKFAALLNEKKKELRKRSRQLGTVQVTSEQLKKIEDLHGPASEQKNKRGRKRSAQEPSGSDESDAFEQPIDANKSKVANEDEAMGSDRSHSTARSSSTDTAEDDDLDQPIHSQNHPKPASALPSKPAQDLASMPPRRELPFPQKSKEHPKPPVPVPVPVPKMEDEETASEDDEL